MFKFIATLGIASSLITPIASAQGQEPRVSAKCFVELYGGVQTITMATTKESKLNQLAHKLHNRQIFVPGMDERQQILEVHECVLASSKFKSAKANRVDAETPK